MPEPSPVLPISVRAIAFALRHAPAPVRRRILQARRDQKRARRLKREAAGDRSLSRPALHGMDVALAELLGDGGTFVEAGTNDGVVQSNTYYLERFHVWRGVLVEAIPDLAAETRINRPAAYVAEFALTADDSKGNIEMVYGDLMSVVAGARGSDHDDESWAKHVEAVGLERSHRVTVRSRSLSSVLDDAGVADIDLLSLDVEGYEPIVISGLDLQRHAPR